MTSIIDYACSELDRKAGDSKAQRVADVMQAVRAVIAGQDSIPPETRLELLRELDRRWHTAGLI